METESFQASLSNLFMVALTSPIIRFSHVVLHLSTVRTIRRKKKEQPIGFDHLRLWGAVAVICLRIVIIVGTATAARSACYLAAFPTVFVRLVVAVIAIVTTLATIFVLFIVVARCLPLVPPPLHGRAQTFAQSTSSY